MRILWVDNEQLALDFLCELLDWNHYGYDLVGCATNGVGCSDCLIAQPTNI